MRINIFTHLDTSAILGNMYVQKPRTTDSKHYRVQGKQGEGQITNLTERREVLSVLRRSSTRSLRLGFDEVQYDHIDKTLEK